MGLSVAEEQLRSFRLACPPPVRHKRKQIRDLQAKKKATFAAKAAAEQTAARAAEAPGWGQ